MKAAEDVVQAWVDECSLPFSRDWVRQRLTERIADALRDRERAVWREAAEVVRQFARTGGQRTYPWSAKQAEHMAAALARRGEGA